MQTESRGRFGAFGGQYVPETLMNELIRLEENYEYYKNDPEFNAELTRLLNDYAGRPSLLYHAERMSQDLGGAQVYLRAPACRKAPCPTSSISTATPNTACSTARSA